MHYSELHLKQLARYRVRELHASAERHRQLASVRRNWRAQVARTLVALAWRLEPTAIEQSTANA